MNGITFNTRFGTISLNDSTVDNAFDRAFGWVDDFNVLDISVGNTPNQDTSDTAGLPDPQKGLFGFTKNQMLVGGIGLAVVLTVFALAGPKKAAPQVVAKK